MAKEAKEAGEFNLIITEVDSGRISEAATAFAQAFTLDEALAGQILKSAPIIFATKLTKSEVKAITPKLTELSSLGLEFRVTARVAGKVPKVNWPVRPQFTAGGSGGANGLAFEWDNNAFVCPSCGETFLFRRLGKLRLSDSPAVSSAKPAAAPAPAMARTPGKQAPVPQEENLDFGDEAADLAAPEPLPEGDQSLEGEPLPGEGESLELPEAGDDIQLEEAPLEEPAAAEPEPEPVVEPDAEPVQLSAAAEEAQAKAEAPAAEAGAGELYNVFLSKITDKSRQDKVAELIGKVKGCSVSEAKDLTTRLVIPIAKNVGKKQAEDILDQFKKIKIFGRMTKVK